MESVSSTRVEIGTIPSDTDIADKGFCNSHRLSQITTIVLTIITAMIAFSNLPADVAIVVTIIAGIIEHAIVNACFSSFETNTKIYMTTNFPDRAPIPPPPSQHVTIVTGPINPPWDPEPPAYLRRRSHAKSPPPPISGRAFPFQAPKRTSSGPWERSGGVGLISPLQGPHRPQGWKEEVRIPPQSSALLTQRGCIKPGAPVSSSYSTFGSSPHRSSPLREVTPRVLPGAPVSSQVRTLPVLPGGPVSSQARTLSVLPGGPVSSQARTLPVLPGGPVS